MRRRFGFRRRGPRFGGTVLIAAALLAAAAVAGMAGNPDHPASAVSRAEAPAFALNGPARVIDGDTIEVAGERIRFRAIDAPEGAQTCGGIAVGPRARAALTRLIGGQAVSCARRGRDRYDRVLADCDAGGVDLQAALVREGWAWNFRRYAGDAYQAEENAARAESLGVWALACEPPWAWRARESARRDSASAPTGQH